MDEQGTFPRPQSCKYQYIEMYESFVRQILPAEVRQLISHHCSISKSGHLNKGQGYDLILKEENKQVNVAE